MDMGTAMTHYHHPTTTTARPLRALSITWGLEWGLWR